MRVLVAILLFSSFALAETATYDVKGMKCEDCIKNIEAKVCHLEGITECKVEVGHITVSTKEGTALDKTKIASAVEKAGHYKIVEPTATTKKKH